MRNYKVKGVRVRVFDPDDERYAFETAAAYRANTLICRVEVIRANGQLDGARMAEAVYRHTGGMKAAAWDEWDTAAECRRPVPILRLRAPA